MIIFSAKGKREHSLAIYQTAIDEWNNYRRDEFSNLEIHTIHASTSSSSFDKWDNTNYVRILDHDYYGDLPTYNPLMYHLMQAANEIGFTELYSKFNTSMTVNFDIEITENNDKSVISLSDVPVMQQTINTNIGRTMCEFRGSYYSTESNECITYSLLSGFCVKISKTNDRWELNSTFGGYDCTGGFQHSSPFKYTDVKIEKGKHIEDYLPLSLSTFKADLRSGHDPYFYVEQLTEDTNSFGIDSRTCFVLGVVILFI